MATFVVKVVFFKCCFIGHLSCISTKADTVTKIGSIDLSRYVGKVLTMTNEIFKSWMFLQPMTFSSRACAQ